MRVGSVLHAFSERTAIALHGITYLHVEYMVIQTLLLCVLEQDESKKCHFVLSQTRGAWFGPNNFSSDLLYNKSTCYIYYLRSHISFLQ